RAARREVARRPAVAQRRGRHRRGAAHRCRDRPHRCRAQAQAFRSDLRGFCCRARDLRARDCRGGRMTPTKTKERAHRPPPTPPPHDRTFVLTVVVSAIAVPLYAVLVPVHADIYGAPVAITMALALAAVGAPLIAL